MRGAAALAAQAGSDEAAERFVAHLRSSRAAVLARLTGGASLLHPDAIGMANPYAAAVAGDGAALAARDDELLAVDAGRLGRYVSSLLPTDGGALVFLRAGGGGMARRLSDALPIAATLYAAERGETAQQALVRSASGAHNMRPVPLSETADAEAGMPGLLDGLPVSPNVALAVLSADWLVPRLAAIAAKLAPGGRLLCVEEEPEALDSITCAAAAAGMQLQATPDIANKFFAASFVLR